jgi:hypothetical protein
MTGISCGVREVRSWLWSGAGGQRDVTGANDMSLARPPGHNIRRSPYFTGKAAHLALGF